MRWGNGHSGDSHGEFGGFVGSRGGVDQMLGLFFHPFLVIELHVIFVFSTSAVCFADAGRIVRQMCIAIVTVIFRHGDDITIFYERIVALNRMLKI